MTMHDQNEISDDMLDLVTGGEEKAKDVAKIQCKPGQEAKLVADKSTKDPNDYIAICVDK
jgi:hypothetical protein